MNINSEGLQISIKLMGAIALWGALFFGEPDIADGIIHYLMNVTDMTNCIID